MQARTHGVRRSGIGVRTHQHRVLRLERGTSGRSGLLPSHFHLRIDPPIQRLDPPFPLLIAHRRHDQQISRARRGDVRKPHSLGLVTREFFRLVLNQIAWGTAGNPNRARALPGIEIPARRSGAQFRGDVGKYDDGEFEPFRFVHGHHADAVAALFENRGLSCLTVFGLRAQLLDESAKRDPSVRLVTACELRDVKHIGQHLLAAMLQRKPHMHARGIEQRRNGRRNRNVIARTMQLLQKRQGLDDGGAARWGVFGNTERMETP